MAVCPVPLVNNNLLQNGKDFVLGATPSKVSGTASRGVANPFGAGASAYEPNTQIYDPSNDPLMAGSSTQLSGVSEADKAAADKAAADQLAAGTATANTGASGTPVANGSVLSFINAAKQLIGKPYVWGGTTINGTDCSGLLYYAFNAAGVKMPRYRASDYGKMGQQVTADAARPGDVVYWDEAGDTDHVGIYLGGGMVLNSPHSGTTTQIDRVWGNPVYRRIMNDDQFGQLAQPTGSPVLSYAGQSANSLFLSPTPTTVPNALGIRSTASPASGERTPTSGFKVKAI